jgi:hypothetical protein
MNAMHRKKPRKVPVMNCDEPRTPWIRRLPPPPPLGVRRTSVVAGVYLVAMIGMTLLIVATATAMAWILRGSPLWSVAGLAFNAVCIYFLGWTAMYLIGGLERWRLRKR